ncbi:NagB/RpiA/CoA transferase-like superfamily protein [Actinidia rufa]|uniref:NagB/RpiA/CoA transferase-like superfamily protein n=1 Tax=Actinidia rufa TaxID=165716 RepID=A0A7J0ECW8_9ERIC|nr:NagB/RpiA/CoA transferase-like superfamily protein [Actinidia rufa]
MASSSSIFTTNLRTHLSPLLQSPPYAPSICQSDVAKPVLARSLRLNRISRIGVNYKKFEFKARSSMAEIAAEKGKGKVQVFDSEEDLVSLAKSLANTPPIYRISSSRREALSPLFCPEGKIILVNYRKLVESPYIDSVEWSKWHVFWVDERVVPKDHEDSNYKLAYDCFLSRGLLVLSLAVTNLIPRSCDFVLQPRIKADWKILAIFFRRHCDTRADLFSHQLTVTRYQLFYEQHAAKPRFVVPIPPGNVYAINDAPSAEGAADDYETCLKHLVKLNIIELSQATGFPKFDLMLIGMGPDGHVASLFPGHPLVHANKQWVAFIEDSPKPPPKRITFTFPVINSSANIALVVAGAGKADAVNVALGNGQSSNTLPVQMVSPEGELTWFLDKGAASKL